MGLNGPAAINIVMNPETEYAAPKEHGDLMKMVEQHLSATKENADEAKLDRDYFDGDQISGVTLATLKARGQPPIYTNKIGNSLRGMFGLIESAATDPQAFPRTPRSQDAADLVTKVLRYVADRAQMKKVKRNCAPEFLIEGSCAAIMEFDGRDITLAPIDWCNFIYDPLSVRADFSDAKWLGVAKMMDRDDVSAMFENFDGDGGPSEDFYGFNDDDAKRTQYWHSPTRKLVRVCDVYYNVGSDWHRIIFTASQTLYAGPSEYVDEDGETFCPITAVSHAVSRKGDRYGVVRDMRPLQDEVNARRSRMLHLTNTRQVRQTALNVQQGSKEIAKAEAAKADGALPYGWESVPSPDLAQGQMLLMQQSTADLDRMAPTPAVLSQTRGANQSGRASQIIQQAGFTELAYAFGMFEDWEESIYKKMWFCARQYLTEPMFIRIADDPRAIEFMTINEPVMGLVEQPIVDPESGMQIDSEIVQGVVGYENRIAELDMEIIISTTPDTQTLQQEAFEAIVDLSKGLGISPIDPMFELVVELSPMPNKREALERIEAFRNELMQQQAQQEQDPMEAEAMKLTLAEKKAEIAKDQAKALKDITSAQAQKHEMRRKDAGLN